VSFAVRAARIDLLLLLAWTGLVVAAAWYVARRQTAI